MTCTWHWFASLVLRGSSPHVMTADDYETARPDYVF